MSIFHGILARIANEPAAFLALVTAVLAFLIGFKIVVLTPEQTGLALGAIVALLALVRQLVTPVSSPVLPSGTEVVVTTPGDKATSVTTV